MELLETVLGVLSRLWRVVRRVFSGGFRDSRAHGLVERWKEVLQR